MSDSSSTAQVSASPPSYNSLSIPSSLMISPPSSSSSSSSSSSDPLPSPPSSPHSSSSPSSSSSSSTSMGLARGTGLVGVWTGAEEEMEEELARLDMEGMRRTRNKPKKRDALLRIATAGIDFITTGTTGAADVPPNKTYQALLSSSDPFPPWDPKDLDLYDFIYHLDPSCSCSPEWSHEKCGRKPRCVWELRPFVHELESRVSSNPSRQKREPDQFVGLQNLGATCYMNTLLQTLFMNYTFRSAIYSWPMELEKESQSVCYQLMWLFAMMEQGPYKSINPRALTDLLNIKTSVRQDVQEFNALFMSYLERKFRKSKVEGLVDLIKNQFEGKFEYSTTCKKCKQQNFRLTSFNELVVNLSGDNCTLQESLKMLVKDEKLVGDNKYMCEKCGGLQEAVRSVRLAELPEVVNLQLLRFVYDLESNRKRKLDSTVRFLLSLSLSDFCTSSLKKTSSPDHFLYELSAVLLHLGDSAYSGHYVAHIRDERTNKWYCFDDSRVTPLEEDQIGDNFFPTGDSSVKTQLRSRLASAFSSKTNKFSSKNAYMLVYTRKDRHVPEIDFPASVAARLANESSSFESSTKEYAEVATGAEERLKKFREEYQKFIKIAYVDPAKSSEFYFVSVKWLRKWLEGTCEEPIDNTDITCVHGRCYAGFDSNRKVISKEAWDVLYSAYGGGPVLSSASLCPVCTERTYDHLSRQRALSSEISMARHQLKINPKSGYWISTAWLREFEECGSRWSDLQRLEPNINELITCPHGDLVPNKMERKMVTVLAWTWLRAHWEKGHEFSSETEPCAICSADYIARRKESDRRRQEIENERHALRGMLSIPRGFQAGFFCLVERRWWDRWRQYVINHYQPPGPIDNTSLVCERHGGLTHDPLDPSYSQFNRQNAPYVAVHAKDWDRAVELYGGGPRLSVMVTKKEGAKRETESGQEMYEYETEPGVCGPCVEERKVLEMANLVVFDSRRVTVLVKRSSGPEQRITVLCSSDDLVLSFKRRAASILSLPLHQCDLFFNDSLLDDLSSLASNQVHADSVLVLKRVKRDAPQRQEGPAFENSRLLEGSGEWSMVEDDDDGEDDDNRLSLHDPDLVPSLSSAPSSSSSSSSAPKISSSSSSPSGTASVSPRSGSGSGSGAMAMGILPAVSSMGKREEGKAKGQWECSQCTLMNPDSYLACEICGHPRK